MCLCDECFNLYFKLTMKEKKRLGVGSKGGGEKRSSKLSTVFMRHHNDFFKKELFHNVLQILKNPTSCST